MSKQKTVRDPKERFEDEKCDYCYHSRVAMLNKQTGWTVEFQKLFKAIGENLEQTMTCICSPMIMCRDSQCAHHRPRNGAKPK